MKYEVVGVQRKSGEYNGRPYDNTYFHVLSVSPNVIGRMTGAVKMKTTAFSDFLAAHGLASTDLIGKIVDIGFDQYRNVERVDVLDKPGK